MFGALRMGSNYSGQRALIVVECLCGFRVHTPEASTRSGILRRGLQRYELSSRQMFSVFQNWTWGNGSRPVG